MSIGIKRSGVDELQKYIDELNRLAENKFASSEGSKQIMSYIFGKHKRDEIGLEVYNAGDREPRSSVMDSFDYDFAVQKYRKSDFRFKFVKHYMKHIEATYGIQIFNCKFERPRVDSPFLNFFIYLWKDDPTIHYIIEDPQHIFVMAFYKILSENPLPGISKDLHVQFIQKNIRKVMNGKVLRLTWKDIHTTIQDVFPQVAELSYWSVFYVFIRNEDFKAVEDNILLLDQIKEYCFKMAKKHDEDNILDWDQFQIRVDSNENYNGGYQYFNSDLMSDCLLY